jgi:DNA polymerase epsilon subunit 3
MPPRKSDASKVATDAEGAGTPAKESSVTEKGAKEKDGINIEVTAYCTPFTIREPLLTSAQDLNLPKSIVTRLAKGVLPPNTQIQGNAMLAMSKSATVFVNYLATQYVQASSLSITNPQLALSGKIC